MSADFFARDAAEVAPRLLGSVLTTHLDGEVSLRITEVEIYRGSADPGSHAYRGSTQRNASMFGPPGRLYVYRHLGLHHCVNVVCSPEGTATAILLRAGEIVAGTELARARRTATGVARTDVDLARGPARLAVALGLDRHHDGADVTSPGGKIYLDLTGEPAAAVSRGGRVGVSGEGGDPDAFPWRLWITADPTVSAYRRAH